MISPITGSLSVAEAHQQTQPAPSQSTSQPSSVPQDKVSLSQQAHPASVDVDHDGDSH